MSTPAAPLARLPDWQQRYAAFVGARRDAPFEWGSNDCALFAADCVQAVTGADVALPELRAHTDAASALALVQAHGGLAAMASAALGAEPLPPAFANVADVVLLDVDGRESLGICNGTTAFAPGPQGLAVLGMDSARACWKVGA